MSQTKRTRKVSDKEITAQHIEKLNEDHSKELEAARERIKELETASEERHEEYTEKVSYLETLLEQKQESHKAQVNKNVEAYLKLQEKNNELAEQNSNLSHSESVLKQQIKLAENLYAQSQVNRDNLIALYEEELTRLRKANKRNFLVFGGICIFNVVWSSYITFLHLCH